MAQSMQLNEPSTKMNLTQLPKEILEYILIHLDFDGLLTASHVCKLFASVAETAFARKNSNEYYNIDCSSKPERYKDKIIIDKYGAQMQKISINSCDEKLLELVKHKCCNLKGLELEFVRKIIMLENLKEVYFRGGFLNRETFDEFISNNQQLERLELDDTDDVLLDLLDGRLNMLKKLALTDVQEMHSLEYVPKTGLTSLETLTFTNIHDDESIFYSPLLRALSSNKIKHLGFYGDVNENEDIIDEVCKFKALVALHMSPYHLKSDQVRKLAIHLPDLIELNMQIAESEPNPDNLIDSTLSVFPKLTKLSVGLHVDHSDRLSNKLKTTKSVKDFHTRFAKDNFKIVLKCSALTVVITKDRLLEIGAAFVKVHWMENLNEKDVRAVMTRLNRIIVKFVNHCAHHAFDITAIGRVHTGPSKLKCLEFKSIGPISINSNALLWHIFFPCLKVLKIHLVQHTANDFLRSLDAIFCEQIEELWLNTTDVFNDPDVNIFSKFKNLKSLYAASSSFKYILGEVFAVCQNLTEFKRFPYENTEQKGVYDPLKLAVFVDLPEN